MRITTLCIVLSCLLGGCLPKEMVELRDITNLVVLPSTGGDPVLSGDALFYNPNASRMKLKSIKVDVFVDDKKSATVDHELDVIVKGKKEFTVPLKVQLQMKDIGLMDAIKSLFGGKTYKIHYVGVLKVNVNGIPFKIPIDHEEDFKLKF